MIGGGGGDNDVALMKKDHVNAFLEAR